MTEENENIPSEDLKDDPPMDRISSPATRRRDVFLIAAAVLVGLLGAHASSLFWTDNGPEASSDLSAVVPGMAETDAVEAPPSPRPAPKDNAPREELPLPTEAQPLLDEVAQIIDRLIATYPGSLDCLEMKARYQKWTGKSEEAVKTWQHCLELDPRYAHAYLGMAEVAAKKGEHAQAAEFARKAVDSGPRLFQARAVLGEALINLRRPEDTIEVLEQYLETDPRSYGYFLLGRAYTLLQQFEKAKKNYEASIHTYPDYPEAHYGLSRTCIRLGEKDTAREAMTRYRELMAERYPGRQGMDMTPESFEELCADAAIIYTDAGRIYLVGNQSGEAERLLRRAAALSPGNLECRRALAWMSRSKDNATETIHWLEEIAALDPADSSPWLEIGNLQLDRLQLQAAEEAFQKACRVAPRDARGHAALAALYMRSGQKNSEALTLARKAIGLAPTAANYSLLAAACERNGDSAGAAEAKALAAKQGESGGEK